MVRRVRRTALTDSDNDRPCGAEPGGHLSLIWFAVWSSVIHAAIMTVWLNPWRSNLVR
ncbi:DUF6632 domain-containing protein [Mycobacterium simulans]|uniref:DUF6632 domain-containing protein n=1 Tax=Mycobacterium simulans TaxID=627089 RepID=UPI0036F3D769